MRFWLPNFVTYVKVPNCHLKMKHAHPKIYLIVFLNTKTIRHGLLDICIGDIADAMESSYKRVAIPHQNLITISAVLGKRKGHRTIGLLPMVWSISNRIRKQVKTWESTNCLGYDAAKKGSSALTAALCRNLLVEISYWLDLASTLVLLDFAKFFDTMDPVYLMKEAKNYDYPLVDLLSAMQQHLAPRIIRLLRCHSQPIQINNSIIAGCLQSIPFVRVYLRRLMTTVLETWEHIIASAFVDDSNFLTIIDKSKLSMSQSIQNIVAAVSYFCTGAKATGLKLSTKKLTNSILGCIVA